MNTTTSAQLPSGSGGPSPGSLRATTPSTRGSPRPHSSRYRRTVVAFLLLLLCALLVLGGLAYTQGFAFFSPRATITVTPKAASERQDTTITAVTGVPTPGQAQARWLVATPPATHTTTTATGSKHQEAQPGHGKVTFFNQATYSIDIPSGVLLTGRDGIQVITDAPAHVPAGDPGNYYGSYDVPAHAVNPGPSGNISAGDIDMLCCANGIVAKNMRAFSGGQDARTFSVVQPSDISSASSPLVTSLMQQAQADLRSQAHTGEQLTPAHCTQQVQADHAVGQEATRVAITVSVNCRSEAYDKQQVDSLAAASFQQQVDAALGLHYRLTGPLTIAPAQVPTADAKGTLSIPISTSGLWVYQVDQQTLHAALQHLLGKSQQIAQTQIANLPGVERVTIEISGGGTTLPNSSDQITLVVAVPHAV